MYTDGYTVVYPRSNRGLFDSVRRHGALVSEYYLVEAPLAWRFPARNRIIAGLASTVVVVEAPEHSGALITASHAIDAGRDVWTMPGPLGVRECRGSNGLLADGLDGRHRPCGTRRPAQDRARRALGSRVRATGGRCRSEAKRG